VDADQTQGHDQGHVIVEGADVREVAQTAGVIGTVIVAAAADRAIGAGLQFASQVVTTVAADQLRMDVPEVLVSHRHDLVVLVMVISIKEVRVAAAVAVEFGEQLLLISGNEVIVDHLRIESCMF
jgi:hypothetical protein